VLQAESRTATAIAGIPRKIYLKIG